MLNQITNTAADITLNFESKRVRVVYKVFKKKKKMGIFFLQKLFMTKKNCFEFLDKSINKKKSTLK